MLAAITKQPLTEDGKALCPLWDFRYGKNPNRKVTVATPKQLEARKLFAEHQRAISEGKISRTKERLNENPGVLVADKA